MMTVGNQPVLFSVKPFKAQAASRQENFCTASSQSIRAFRFYSQKEQRLFPSTALIGWFLDAFAKLQKATIRFVKSVRPHKTLRFPLDGF
jgi:hypothetical protein